MKKLLSSFCMTISLLSAGSAFALNCSDVNSASARFDTWNEKVNEVLVENIGFPANLSFWAAKEGFKSKTAPVSGAVSELTSVCDIATEKDEALRYFKAWSYLLNHGGPISSYFATQVDIGAKIIEAANAIGAAKGFQLMNDGMNSIRLTLKGESCSKGIFYDSECDWSNNDFDKIVAGVSVIFSDGSDENGSISNCRGPSQGQHGDGVCPDKEPFDYERDYAFTFDPLEGKTVDYIRITTKDGGRMYIPFKKGYVKIGDWVMVDIPLYINDKKQVRYNY